MNTSSAMKTLSGFYWLKTGHQGTYNPEFLKWSHPNLWSTASSMKTNVPCNLSGFQSVHSITKQKHCRLIHSRRRPGKVDPTVVSDVQLHHAKSDLSARSAPWSMVHSVHHIHAWCCIMPRSGPPNRDQVLHAVTVHLYKQLDKT